jgi:pimeloyl-ACP methyl ester carboxylesterase
MKIGANRMRRRVIAQAVTRMTPTRGRVLALLWVGLGGTFDGAGLSAQAPTPSAAFEGVKTLWHGFDRHDFLMNEESLAIAPADEKVKGDVEGQRRCIVVTPKVAAPGNPWSWRGCYWDPQPQTEIELLRRGFHIAYITANASWRPDKKWDAWYAFLTERHGLSRKPAFIAMSRGGEYAYTWATANPDKVACIYAENPVLRSSMSKYALLDHLAPLAKAGVPLLHVCGGLDPWLGSQTRVAEQRYKQLGGLITVIVREGEGHLPVAPQDTKPVVDFIARAAK